MSGEPSQAEGSGLSPARGLAGLIAANISLIVAIMVYMGWAYEGSYYGYFHLNPLDLGIGVQNYLLSSLNLFKPIIVVAAVIVIAVILVVARGAALAEAATNAIRWVARTVQTSHRLRRLSRMTPNGLISRLPALRRLWKPRALLSGLGIAMTAAGLVLYGIAGDVPVSTYVVLTLLALGPLLVTGTLRGSRQGRVPYSIAVAVLIVCALWAGSLYASGLGNDAARDFAAHLPTSTEVAVYSVEPIALSGRLVTRQTLSAGLMYHYRYVGLRLLYMNAGTYYLLPEGWEPQMPLTYILNASDQTSVVLY